MSMYDRTRLLLGEDAMNRLAAAHVAVFGVGGVGGAVCEALARSGVGHLTIVDKDVAEESNLNRQIVALRSTIGCAKAEVMRQRILDINPDCEVNAVSMFYLPETADELPLEQFDMIADCIDTVTAKLFLASRAQEKKIPLIAAMGAGNRLDPSALRLGDISETSVCGLCRIMRKECRKRGIERLRVAYSTEEPIPVSAPKEEGDTRRKDTPASCMFVPTAMGMLIASDIVRTIIGKEKNHA